MEIRLKVAILQLLFCFSSSVLVANEIENKPVLSAMIKAKEKKELLEIRNQIADLESHLLVDHWDELAESTFVGLKDMTQKMARAERNLLVVGPLSYPEVKDLLFPSSYNTAFDLLESLFGSDLSRQFKVIVLNGRFYTINHAQRKMALHVYDHLGAYMIRIRGFDGKSSASRCGNMKATADITRKMMNLIKDSGDTDAFCQHFLSLSVPEGEAYVGLMIANHFSEKDRQINVMIAHRIVWHKGLVSLNEKQWGLPLANLFKIKTKSIVKNLRSDLVNLGYDLPFSRLGDASFEGSAHDLSFILRSVLLTIDQEIIERTSWQELEDESETLSQGVRQKFGLDERNSLKDLNVSESESTEDRDNLSQFEDDKDFDDFEIVYQSGLTGKKKYPEQNKSKYKRPPIQEVILEDLGTEIRITSIDPGSKGLKYIITLEKSSDECYRLDAKPYTWKGRQLKLVRNYKDEKATCPLHQFPKRVDCFLDYAKSSNLNRDVTGTFLWLPGTLKVSQGDGKSYQESGRFEYCLDEKGRVFHRFFRPQKSNLKFAS